MSRYRKERFEQKMERIIRHGIRSEIDIDGEAGAEYSYYELEFAHLMHKGIMAFMRGKKLKEKEKEYLDKDNGLLVTPLEHLGFHLFVEKYGIYQETGLLKENNDFAIEEISKRLRRFFIQRYNIDWSSLSEGEKNRYLSRAIEFWEVFFGV